MFRCLLDDFITLLHFNFHDFDKNLIVKHTADGFNEKFKTLQASKKANYKFHQGKKTGMVDEVFYQKEKDKFLADQGNHIMLSNVAGFEFKTFISTSAIADLFPKSDTGEAFCHAFVLWRHLSSYVHYTNFTFVLENDEPAREIEIKQLKEAVYYSYFTIEYCCKALTTLGRTLVIPNTTKLIKEITTPFQE